MARTSGRKVSRSETLVLMQYAKGWLAPQSRRELSHDARLKMARRILIGPPSVTAPNQLKAQSATVGWNAPRAELTRNPAVQHSAPHHAHKRWRFAQENWNAMTHLAG